MRLSTIVNKLTGTPFETQKTGAPKGKTTKPSEYFVSPKIVNESPNGYSGVYDIKNWPVFKKK